MSARDKVKLGESWTKGDILESLVTVQNNRFMPRLQLEAKRLWISWGKRIWCHQRLPDGRIAKTPLKRLRAHSDDVSNFVVSDGKVVSGGWRVFIC